MIDELRFAIRCHGSTKKPRLRRRCSQCTAHHSAFSGLVPPAPVAPLAATSCTSDRTSSNGLLIYQSASSSAADELLHRRRTRVPHDQRDITCTTADSRYRAPVAMTTTSDDVTGGRGPDDLYWDVNNDRLRQYVNETAAKI